MGPAAPGFGPAGPSSGSETWASSACPCHPSLYATPTEKPGSVRGARLAASSRRRDALAAGRSAATGLRVAARGAAGGTVGRTSIRTVLRAIRAVVATLRAALPAVLGTALIGLVASRSFAARPLGRVGYLDSERSGRRDTQRPACPGATPGQSDGGECNDSQEKDHDLHCRTPIATSAGGRGLTLSSHEQVRSDTTSTQRR
jgi:hypothetical protein